MNLVTRACLIGWALAAAVPVHAGRAERAERFTRIAGIRLADEPGLARIQQRLGRGHVTRTGDAAEFQARVCYRSAHGGTVVALFHGEVDWGFVLRRATGHDAACPMNGRLDDATLSVAGIRLGMTRAAFRQRVGPARGVGPHHLHAHFQYMHVLSDVELSKRLKQPITSGSFPAGAGDALRWHVDIFVDGTFAGDRLVSFTVDRVEVN